MKLGLIGEKLPHSYSKEIFEEILGHPSYELVELRPEEVAPFLRETDLNGFNVTVPYKTAVLLGLTSVSDLARRIGAVNTVRRDGTALAGTNTDYYGLRAMLRRGGFDLSGKTVLVLGTGGTSKTAVAVCRDAGAKEVIRVSRTAREGAVTYEQARAVRAQYVINTTPCGMFPQTGEAPVNPTDWIRPGGETLLGVADVIYNPLRTELAARAKEAGIPAVTGLFMLAAQAVAAEAFFLGREVPESELDARAETVYRALLKRRRNLVLIGMPSSGKTTVGRALAERLGKPFYDTDGELKKKIGPIPEYIRRNGEEAFRLAEAETVRDLTARVRGAVIATGGGAVLRAENRRALGENGAMILLERDADEIVFDPTRPLSDTREKWEALRQAREPVYRAAADLTVRGFRTPEQACDRILEVYE